VPRQRYIYCEPFIRPASGSLPSVDAGIQDIIPSTRKLYFRSTWNHCGNLPPVIATLHPYRIFQLVVFVVSSINGTPGGVQENKPSIHTLAFRSTSNHFGNGIPIIASELLSRIFQLFVFAVSPFAGTHHGVQETMPFHLTLFSLDLIEVLPSILTLFFRSTKNLFGNGIPSIACWSYELAIHLQVRIVGSKTPCHALIHSLFSFDLIAVSPSILTLYFRSAKNHFGNSIPLIAAEALYRIFQLVVFVRRSIYQFDQASGRR
jgi:hypothetical protein